MALVLSVHTLKRLWTRAHEGVKKMVFEAQFDTPNKAKLILDFRFWILD